MADVRNSGQYTAVILPHAESRSLITDLRTRGRIVFGGLVRRRRSADSLTLRIWPIF
jgi:hypothetical protein